MQLYRSIFGIERNIEKYRNISILNRNGYCGMKNWNIDLGINIANINLYNEIKMVIAKSILKY